MINKTQAKLLNRNQTIDLRYMLARELCDNVELSTIKDKATNYGYIVLHYLGMFALIFIISFAIFFMLTSKSSANYINPEFKYYGVDNYRDYERSLRLEVCERVYKENKEFIDETFIHTTQNPVVRCATMITLIGSYESDYFKSSMCVKIFNCFGIKDWYTGNFKVYNSMYEGYLDFARLYLVGNGTMEWKGHKNRDITEFVWNWSQTDRETYINFVNSKYWVTYKEIKSIY